MNIITLHSLCDLQEILDAPLYLSGTHNDISREIEQNMWCIGLDEHCAQTITVKNLEDFFAALIARKQSELGKQASISQATLYVWFDAQALQLRVNIISGDGTSLPFQCKLHRVNSLVPIIDDFMTTVQNVALHGETIEILDNLIDEQDDACAENFTLNVYVMTFGHR